MNNPFSHLLQLGFAIVIMSSSGTLGRYIELPPPATIWIRCVLGTIALFLVLKLARLEMHLGKRQHFRILFISSMLLGLHWVTYFYSLQLSSVAIGMLSLFTYPVITALLEPLILKTKFQASNLILALIAFAGVAFLVPELNFENKYTLGILIGIFSALCYSVRNILLKKRVSDQSGITLMFYQLLFISLLFWPLLLLHDFDLTGGIGGNWQALLILGFFTTATGHTLFVMSFRHFTISTVSIISSLTPLLGILLGYLVLHEVPTGKTLTGGFLIFLTVVAESIKSVRRNNKTVQEKLND